MKFGSLFSGIGGLDLGLERAGMICSWQVEIDPYCQKVLKKHWPDVPKFPDVRTVDFERVERVDLVAGGFPCQPVSQAGLRKAQDDKRWLWPDFARCLRVLRPRFVLLENVPGLLVRGAGDVLGNLAALGYRFDVESLPASAFGAPHIRDRVFVVAYTLREPIRVLAGGLDGETGEREGEAPQRQRLWSHSSDGSPRAADAPNTYSTGREEQRGARAVFPEDCAPQLCSWWEIEPSVGRVVDGFPGRVDRLRGLGNAVVPQVAEWIGRRILEFDKEMAA